MPDFWIANLRNAVSFNLFEALLLRRASALIAVGLFTLLAAILWPQLPTATAFALIALGATGATISRLQQSPAIVPAMASHVFVYGSLYGLFVGAMLHAVGQNGQHVSTLLACDIAISGLLIAIALGMACRVLSGDRAAR